MAVTRDAHPERERARARTGNTEHQLSLELPALPVVVDKFATTGNRTDALEATPAKLDTMRTQPHATGKVVVRREAKATPESRVGETAATLLPAVTSLVFRRRAPEVLNGPPGK